jgi:hypothetical protein
MAPTFSVAFLMPLQREDHEDSSRRLPRFPGKAYGDVIGMVMLPLRILLRKAF